MIWSARLAAVAEVLFFIEVGMILLLLPWTTVWVKNSLVAGHELLEALVYSGFARGVVSGLGLINLGYGVRAAFKYQDPI